MLQLSVCRKSEFKISLHKTRHVGTAMPRMGFLAFTLDVKMAMPRVATTMLALVSLTNLRNSVVATLPASGNMSWLEEILDLCVL